MYAVELSHSRLVEVDWRRRQPGDLVRLQVGVNLLKINVKTVHA